MIPHLHRSKTSTVDTVSRLWLAKRRVVVRFPVRTTIQAGSEAHPAYCSMGTGGSSWGGGGKSDRGEKLTTHFLLVLKLRMNGVTHPPLYHTPFRRAMGQLCIFRLLNRNLKRTHTNDLSWPNFSCGDWTYSIHNKRTHTYLEMLKIFATSNTYKHTHQHRNNAFRSQEQRILQKEMPPLQIMCVWNI